MSATEKIVDTPHGPGRLVEMDPPSGAKLHDDGVEAGRTYFIRLSQSLINGSSSLLSAGFMRRAF